MTTSASSFRPLDLVIVGAGPAGLTAAITAARARLAAVVLEGQLAGGTLLKTEHLENWPGDVVVSGMELAQRMHAHALHAGAEIREGVQVDAISVRPDGLFHVTTTDGQQTLSRTVIITAGGTPKRLGIPGEDRLAGRGISWCAVCDGPMCRNQVIYVVGGSDSAVEESAYLARFGQQVVLVHRGEALRAAPVLQERLAALPNVSVRLHTQVVGAMANTDGVLSHLELQDVRTGAREIAHADWLFEFIGFTPNTATLPSHLPHDSQGFLLTDAHMATPIPGLFAAGDVRAQYVRQVTTAVGDGTTAACAAHAYVEAQKDLERHIERAAEIMQEITC